MTTEPVIESRVVSEETTSGLRLRWPAERPLGLMIFLSIWLVGWVIGEFAAGPQVISRAQVPSAAVFGIVWMLGWTFGGATALLMLLWYVGGREQLVLTSATLDLRREIFGVGQTRQFALDHVARLRLVPVVENSKRQGRMPALIGGGSVAFDYGARTIRFGSGLEEAEANALVDLLQSRHPALVEREIGIADAAPTRR